MFWTVVACAGVILAAFVAAKVFDRIERANFMRSLSGDDRKSLIGWEKDGHSWHTYAAISAADAAQTARDKTNTTPAADRANIESLLKHLAATGSRRAQQ